MAVFSSLNVASDAAQVSAYLVHTLKVLGSNSRFYTILFEFFLSKLLGESFASFDQKGLYHFRGIP